MVLLNYWVFIFVLLVMVFGSVWRKKLTIGAAILGGIIACFIYLGAGLAGILMLGFFFVAGTIATAIGLNGKISLAAAEENNGRRNSRQVLANGGIAGIAGLMAFASPLRQSFYQVIMAASLAAATADTLSSELGTVFGKRFYDILNFKPGIRGNDGVVSAEGTLAGLVGTLLIAGIYSLFFGFDLNFLWIVLAGTLGNLADSLLGATFERKGYIKNNTVNFLNTFIAAIVAWVILKMG